MKLKIGSWAAVISISFAGVSGAFAQNGNQVISRNPNIPIATAPGGQNQTGNLKPARQFVGQDLKNQQGQKLGKIEDFVLDLESGKILYAVVNAAGGSRALPGTYVQVSPDGKSLTSQATLQQVNSAPVVPKGNVPQGGNLSFATSVYKHFNQPTWWDATSQSGQAFGNIHRATQLTNFQVQDSAGQNIGTIQSPLLDINAGRVAFLLLNASTFLGQANQLIAVPPNAFTKGSGNFLVTGLDKNTLSGAPRVANWAELSNPTKASSIYSYFGKQYYSADVSSVGATTTASTSVPNPVIGQNTQPANQVIAQTSATGRNQLGQIAPAQQFIGRNFQNQQGQNLGTIQDFVVDLESGRILYGVVNVAGSSRGIPIGLMQPSANNSITTQATQQQLNSAPVVPAGSSPQIGDIAFATSVYQAFNQPMWWGASTQAGQSFGNAHRATELANFQVQDSSSQNVGTIQNVLLDLNAGRVAFLILNASTILAQANALIAVPPNAFTKGTGNFLVTGLDKNTLSGAPRATTNWAELSDPTKASSIYSYFGKQPYFGTSGLAPTGRP